MTESRTPPAMGERLAKVMARSGLCSRRDAELWIAEGKVSVNGKVVKTPAFNVTERDKITVNGKPLAARQSTRVWLYHKPAGLVVTEKDPEGRPTIFEALADSDLPRVLSVGRLDINTEGLLLLTNDGGLKRVLELPATGWLRRYRVRAHGSITQAALDQLADGIEIDGVKYGPIEATLEREQGANVWLVLALREGKNREVKNVLGALGLEVNRLIRVSYGPFQLGDLAVGEIETVKDRVLQEQLGERLAREANADFVSDLPEPRRSGRPGAPGGRPGRGDDRFGRDERPAGRIRKIHFDDGRAPLEYKAPEQRRKRGEDDEKPAGKFGKPARGAAAAGKPPRGKSAPLRGEKPLGDRPRRNHGDHPDTREAGEWTRKPRAPRSAAGFDDRSAAPKRSYGSKTHGADASARPARGPRAEGGPARGSRSEGTGSRYPRSEGASRSEGRAGRPPRSGAPGTRAPRSEGGPARGPRSEGGPARSSRPEGGATRGSRSEGFGARSPRASGPGSRGSRPEGAASRGPRPEGASSRPARPARGEGAPARGKTGSGRADGSPKGRGGPRKDGGSGPRTPRPTGGAPRGPRKPRG